MITDPDAKRQEALKQKLLEKMGAVEAAASHAKTVAGGLREAADHHHQAAHADVHQRGAEIRRAGVGADPESELAYCKALMERHRMGQTYELAARDAAQFPDIAEHEQHLGKSLHRLAPAAVHQEYRWGKLLDPQVNPEPDDYQPRLYDPQELLAREIERDKDPEKVEYFRDLFSRRTPEEIDPVVLVRSELGREILDGHHRALGAREADRPVRGVEIGEGTFQRLKDFGFSDMEIAYAVLALGDCWEAADRLKSQYDGKPVRRTGFLAYEHLKKAEGGIDEY